MLGLLLADEDVVDDDDEVDNDDLNLLSKADDNNGEDGCELVVCFELTAFPSTGGLVLLDV